MLGNQFLSAGSRAKASKFVEDFPYVFSKTDAYLLPDHLILDQVVKVLFRFGLPPSMKIHNVFHASLLEPVVPNLFPDRVAP
jgi:hypothetical protein